MIQRHYLAVGVTVGFRQIYGPRHHMVVLFLGLFDALCDAFCAVPCHTAPIIMEVRFFAANTVSFPETRPVGVVTAKGIPVYGAALCL